MMARSPVARSWQKATCSWLNGDGDDGSVTVVTPSGS